MVDAADKEKVEASRNELHNLLEKPQLQGIPVSACKPMSPPETHDFMQQLTSSSCLQKNSGLQTIPD